MKAISLSEHIKNFPHRSILLMEIADKFINKTAVVVRHEDEHSTIPVGTVGTIIGFEGEILDALVMQYGEENKADIVYPGEIQVVRS